MSTHQHAMLFCPNDRQFAVHQWQPDSCMCIRGRLQVGMWACSASPFKACQPEVWAQMRTARNVRGCGLVTSGNKPGAGQGMQLPNLS